MNAALQRYSELLLEWNRTVNLTGARTPEAVQAQIEDADALLSVSWAATATVVDIGSGGGLPAVPLAITFPNIAFSLLEANLRKCAFLEYVAGTLALGNIRVLRGRAEDLAHQPALREQFDRAISRALARPAVVLELALPFVKPGGELIAQVTSIDPKRLEPAAAALGGAGTRLEPAGGRRGVLLIVPKVGPTPPQFPRRAGVPARRPLA